MSLPKKLFMLGWLLASLALAPPPSQASDLEEVFGEVGDFLEKHGDEIVGAYTLYEWYRLTKKEIDSLDEVTLSINNAKEVPEFEKEFGGQVTSNDSEELRQELAMVQAIGEQLRPYMLFLEEKAGKASSLPVQFYLMKSETPNAFAFIADGFRRVCITHGLLQLFEGDSDMVAGVLAHELGHHYLGHNLSHTKAAAKRELERQGTVLVLELLNRLSKFTDPENIKTADVVGSLVQQYFLLETSRQDEAASDEIGVMLIFISGFNKFGLTRAFEEMRRQFGDTPKWINWLSSHPRMSDRIAATKKTADGLPERPPPSSDGPKIVRTARPWELGISSEAAKLKQREGRRIARGDDSSPSDKPPSSSQAKKGHNSIDPAPNGVGSEVAQKLLGSKPGDIWSELPALPQDLVEHVVNVHCFRKNAQPPVPLRVYKASCLRRGQRVFLNVLVVRFRTDVEPERVFVWIPKDFQLWEAWQFDSR